MPSKKKITIRDVAKEAGLSPATVSRVLSNADYAVGETRKLVMDAVERTGYVIPEQAKKMISEKNIVVICSSLRDQASSYFLDGIERKAGETGYHIYIKHIGMNQLMHTKPDVELFRGIIANCNAAGMIIFSDAIEEPIIEQLAKEIPLVTMMTESNNKQISSVDVDEYDMMDKIFRHFMSMQKEKIAIILGQPTYRRNIVLKEIYQKLLQKYHLPENPAWCANIDTNYYATSAVVAAEQMLKMEDAPNAFINATDIYAAGTIFACTKVGLRVPEDVAVCGRDNSSVCHIVSPQISAFDMPSEMIGYTACDNLINALETGYKTVKKVILDCDLIIRESTLSK